MHIEYVNFCAFHFQKSMKHAEEFEKQKVVEFILENLDGKKWLKKSAVLKDNMKWFRCYIGKKKYKKENKRSYLKLLDFGMLLNQTPFWFKDIF